MSNFLNTFRDKIQGTPEANIFFLSEYHNGQLHDLTLAETNPCQNIYSVSKVYVTTAIGLLVDQGLLSVTEVVTDILSGELPAAYDSHWDHITVDDLLLHRVGLPAGFLDIDVEDASSFGLDFLSYVLQHPWDPDFVPGQSTYTDAAFYLLSRIVEKRSGMSCDNFLWKYLFAPTNCREAAWSHCPMGHAMGATGLYIRAQELVKLGMIYLHGGVYQGTRILSQSWTETVLSRGYELKSICGGLAYGKGGMRGQMLLLIPSQDRVVAWTGCGENDFAEFAATYTD